jgi:hypothetical protein
MKSPKFKTIKTEEYDQVFFYESDLRPVTTVPVKSRSWTAQYVIACLVKRYKLERGTLDGAKGHITRVINQYNKDHLGSGVWTKTINDAISTCISMEEKGLNTRPEECERHDGGVISWKFRKTYNPLARLPVKRDLDKDYVEGGSSDD